MTSGMTIRYLLRCFDRRDKAQAAGLLLLMALGAGFEASGTALVFPFIALINNPDLIRESRAVGTIYAWSGLASWREFVIWCGGGLIAVYLFKGAYLSLMYYLQYRFIFSRQVALSTRLFSAYMQGPYVAHVERNSAELLRNVNSEVLWIFSGLLVPGASVVVEALVILAMLAMLMLVEPLPTLAAAVTFGVLGFAVLRPMRRVTTAVGRRQQAENAAMIQCINQGLGGLREAKILGRERFFVEAYRRHSETYARSMFVLRTLTDVPRIGIETLGVAGMVAVVVLFLVRGRDMQLVLPTLAVFALASVRLMPSLNRMIAGVTALRYYTPSVEVVSRDLSQFERVAVTDDPGSRAARGFAFEHRIELREVSFRYPGTAELALRDISLTIEHGQSVAFVGPSGAGKTTLVNVILGLLAPTAGAVLVDGIDVRERIGAWQRMIGYIPQPVYLCDDSIRRNVAFGLADAAIDEARVWAALAAAQLDTFVRGLPQGLDAVVGEDGVRISAGQRQRIGIARALYENPPVLVVDEGTAALDNETEREITRVIADLSGAKTVVLVAHRLSTVRGCDVVFFLKDGRLTAAGSYDAMLATNPEFQRMVRAAEAFR